MQGEGGGSQDETPQLFRSPFSVDTPTHSSLHHQITRTNPVRQSDALSSNIYSSEEVANRSNSAMDNNAISETGAFTLEDIFADMGPQIPYHEEHIDFLGFLDPSSAHAEAEAINSPTMIHPYPSVQQNPSMFSINEFAPITMDTLPGMVIPAHAPPETSLRYRTFVEPSQKRLIQPQVQLQSSAMSVTGQASTIPSIAGPSSETPSGRTQRKSTRKKQLQIKPWTPDMTAPVGTSSMSRSEETSKTESPIAQSKTKSATAGIKRRKYSSSSASESLGSPVKPGKTSHNMIEKRYRLKLNDKILSLRNAVPAIRSSTSPTVEQSILDPEREKISNRLNKGTVLTKATEYIHQLEQEKRELEQEVATLKAQLAVTKSDTPKKQDFEWGGVAAASSVARDNCKGFTISNDGMISPESCTSFMSPEAEGIILEDSTYTSELSLWKRIMEERDW